jgi:hypothetical protein
MKDKMKRKWFEKLYAAIAIGSIIIVGVNAAEYQQFFPALTSLQAVPDSQRIVNDTSANTTWILLYFHITNPSAYSGLRIAWVNIQLNFTAANNSSLPTFNIFSPNSIETPLGPGQTVHINATFPLSPNETKIFAMFYQSDGTAQFAHYVVDIHLLTFLEAIAAFDIYRDISYPIR